MKQFRKLLNNNGVIQPLIIILIIFLLITTALIFYSLGNKKSNNIGETKKVSEVITNLIAKKDGTVISRDSYWNLYTNKNLGFSIQFPKHAYYGYAGCEFKTEGDNSYRPKIGTIPVVVIEDGDTVYIGNEYYYKLTGETTENNRSFFSGCEKVVSDPVLDTHEQQFWGIKITQVKNESDIENYIKEKYGEGCSLGEMLPTTTPNVFDISIQGDGKDLMESECPVNFAYVLKYDVESGRLANWNRGQACYFYQEEYQDCYDDQMTQSFTFKNLSDPEQN